MLSGLASFPFARRYLGNRCFFLFLRVLRCFSSPRYLLCTYVFSTGYLRITTGGFPHSDICGFTDICSSPQLFAACHVLLRLPVPRHPPYALSCLTSLLVFFANYFVNASLFFACLSSYLPKYPAQFCLLFLTILCAKQFIALPYLAF